MHHPTRHEGYVAFLSFVKTESRKEQSSINRRILGVLLWCFGAPVCLTILTAILIQTGILPIRMRGIYEWFFILFPVAYSVYFLSGEVLRDLPTLWRQGGWHSYIRQCEQEGAWRERIVETMARELPLDRKTWEWIAANFRIDLAAMRMRTRLLMILSGIVFFLIMQGFDLIADDSSTRFMEMDFLSINSINSLTLLLFLTLLYLSERQKTNALERYLHCAQLLMQSADSLQSPSAQHQHVWQEP